MLFELINPSDPYTFEAPSIEIAGAAAVLLSTSYGAKCLDAGQEHLRTPMIWGWDAWLTSRGITHEWMADHGAEIATALESLVIGNLAARRDVETQLAKLPADKRAEELANYLEAHRTSMHNIGFEALRIAGMLRANLQRRQQGPRPLVP